MQKLNDISDKRITIISPNGQSVSAPLAPRKGIVFSLFNFSRAQTSGKNTTTVLSKPVPEILHPDTSRADLTAIKNWVALEEKIVHDYAKQKTAQSKTAISLPKTPRPDFLRTGLTAVKNRVSLWGKVVRNDKEQKTAQSKTAIPLPKTPRSDLLRTGLTAVKNRVSLWGKVVRNDKEQKTAQSKTAVPLPKIPRPDVPRVDLTGVKNWVALEEKIVHNYKEQRTPQSKGAVPLPTTSRPDTSRADLIAIKNRVALEEKVVRDYTEQKTAQSKGAVSLPKTPRPDLLRAGLTAVRNWVSLGESVVRNYREKKTAQSKSTVPLPRIPEKQSLPAFETFSTQTAVFSSSPIPKPRDPFLGAEKIFLKLEKFLLVLGWLAAGALMLLYVHETFSSREVSQKLSQIKNEKKLLEQSYAVLKNTLEDQRAEMRWLNGELQDTTSELKTARSEINVLRNTMQTQDAIVKALKAQSQAFEKIIDQGGMSALSGVAAGFSDERFLTGRTSVLRGEVAAVNERQGFVVVNMSAAQGAYPGRWITISRDGRGLAVGRIDRVYPTMSVAVLRNPGMLRVIQEGDSVLFS
ncbi:MAG: hypothetical protein V1673_01650 [Candidatus Omnitrophota bacterium]